MKATKRLVSFGLLLCLCITAAGAVTAVEEVNAEIESRYTNNSSYNFELDMPRAGGKSVDTARRKGNTNSFAYFKVTEIAKASGLACYLNVRDKAGETTVGTAVSVAGTGGRNVTYNRGHGINGQYYSPSGQTDNDATTTANVKGEWKP